MVNDGSFSFKRHLQEEKKSKWEENEAKNVKSIFWNVLSSSSLLFNIFPPCDMQASAIYWRGPVLHAQSCWSVFPLRSGSRTNWGGFLLEPPPQPGYEPARPNRAGLRGFFLELSRLINANSNQLVGGTGAPPDGSCLSGSDHLFKSTLALVHWCHFISLLLRWSSQQS